MSDLDEPELEMVYIAGSIREAKAVEALFAEQEIEYEVAPCAYGHSISFGNTFVGVSFQVFSGQAPYCRHMLFERGFRKGIVSSGVA